MFISGLAETSDSAVSVYSQLFKHNINLQE